MSLFLKGGLSSKEVAIVLVLYLLYLCTQKKLLQKVRNACNSNGQVL